MVVYQGELYIGGLFYQNAGNVSTSIMRWNDTTWRDVAGGVTIGSNPYPSIKQFRVQSGKLFCVGSFEIIGGILANGFASWDGNNWCSYNSIFELTPNQFIGATCLATYKDTLIIGGAFRLIDGDSAQFIAKWIGGNYVDTCGNTTSISELLIDQELVVYPNPSNDVVTFGGLNAAETNTLEIINMQGQIMHTISGKFSEYIFDVRTLPEGLYAVRVSNHKRTITGKLVIRH